MCGSQNIVLNGKVSWIILLQVSSNLCCTLIVIWFYLPKEIDCFSYFKNSFGLWNDCSGLCGLKFSFLFFIVPYFKIMNGRQWKIPKIKTNRNFNIFKPEKIRLCITKAFVVLSVEFILWNGNELRSGSWLWWNLVIWRSKVLWIGRMLWMTELFWQPYKRHILMKMKLLSPRGSDSNKINSFIA